MTLALKTVWMVSGNKGGVGKSLFCLALASALEARGDQYGVLDGDGRTGDVHAAFLRKCPARWGDFRKLKPESHTCSYDAEYEAMLHQLLGACDHLIVNTPDGADNTLMQWFDVTLRHTESNNIQFNFMYLMSDRPDGLSVLPDLAARFQFLYPVRNLHFGSTELFNAFNKNYASEFRTIIDFERLRGEEVRMLFDLATYPEESINLKDRATGRYTVPAMSRSRLLKWQWLFAESVDNVIENKDTPNLTNLVWKNGE